MFHFLDLDVWICHWDLRGRIGEYEHFFGVYAHQSWGSLWRISIVRLHDLFSPPRLMISSATSSTFLQRNRLLPCQSRISRSEYEPWYRKVPTRTWIQDWVTRICWFYWYLARLNPGRPNGDWAMQSSAQTRQNVLQRFISFLYIEEFLQWLLW